MGRWEEQQSYRASQDAGLMNRGSSRIRVRVSNRQDDLKISSTGVRSLVRYVLVNEKPDCKELSVYFVSERRICDLHRKFFNDPSPTDCITFPIGSETFGEIFVCPKAALRYAASAQADPYEEVALYMIHGILHLLGYNDLKTAERRMMRKKERECMAYSKPLIDCLRPR